MTENNTQIKRKANKFFDFGPGDCSPEYKFYINDLLEKASDSVLVNKQSSKLFISYALKNLPEKHFIIFFFDSQEKTWVQFGRNGALFTDVPISIATPFYNKERELLDIFNFFGFPDATDASEDSFDHSNYFKTPQEPNKLYFSYEAFLGNNYLEAADMAMLISQNIFQYKTPLLKKCHVNDLIDITQFARSSLNIQ